MTNEIISYSKIELHYYFKDDSHSMDASIRHDCEKELLQIYKQIISQLGLDIRLETEAYKEGGLTEIWKFIGNNPEQLLFLTTVVTLFISRLPVENSLLVELQIKNLQLDNEIKTQELKKIVNIKEVETQLSNDSILNTQIILDLDYKANWHKSNFYKRVLNCSKITQISTLGLDENNKSISEENFIKRDQFGLYIQKSDSIPSETDENAIIDIISPVLKIGNFNWKGIYNDQVINFEMHDELFKQSVLNNEVEFNNGTAIKCILHHTRRLNEAGHIVISKSKIVVVLEVISDSKSSETDQGRKYKRNKLKRGNQLNLQL